MAQVIPVQVSSDVHVAEKAARAMGREIGFSELASEEIALAARELAANLVKHANQGTLTLERVSESGRTGIRLESRDRGPGIPDVELAIGDGFSTAGSLGYGLGTVNRLMDQLDIVSHRGAPAGTHIVSLRWLRPESPVEVKFPLEFGVATRPRPPLKVNGDAFVVKHWPDGAIVSVIDGLGHGEAAHQAAETARGYVESHFDQPLDNIFRGVARTCRATRGVVMTIVRFDSRPAMRFSLAGIGNVEVRLFSRTGQPQPIVRRGVLGGIAPAPKIIERDWEPGSCMVLQSDGIRQRWAFADFPDFLNRPAAAFAQDLLRKLSRDEDDATVVVVKDTVHGQ